MKWRNLLWAVLTLALSVLIFSEIFKNSHSKLGGDFNLFTIFMIFWTVTSLISPIIVALRVFRKMKMQPSLAYIFLSVLNVYLGGYGIFKLLSSTVQKDFYAAFFLLLLNLIWGGFIFIDVFGEDRASQKSE
jgi:hypothetical protein